MSSPTRTRSARSRASCRTADSAAYLDAQPGNWLIFNAGGPLGGRRYACTAHRTKLTADLQAHYGAMCPLVHDEGPYPALWPHGFTSLDERELADLLAGGEGQPVR